MIAKQDDVCLWDATDTPTDLSALSRFSDLERSGRRALMNGGICSNIKALHFIVHI